MATTTRKPRTTKPVPAPTVELLAWSDGTGTVRINGTEYTLTRLTDNGRTIGARLARTVTEKDGTAEKIIDVDFTAANGWQCDCECAVYDSQRGPCKHCQALRLVKPAIKAAEDAADLAIWTDPRRR